MARLFYIESTFLRTQLHIQQTISHFWDKMTQEGWNVVYRMVMPNFLFEALTVMQPLYRIGFSLYQACMPLYSGFSFSTWRLVTLTASSDDRILHIFINFLLQSALQLFLLTTCEFLRLQKIQSTIVQSTSFATVWYVIYTVPLVWHNGIFSFKFVAVWFGLVGSLLSVHV